MYATSTFKNYFTPWIPPGTDFIYCWGKTFTYEHKCCYVLEIAFKDLSQCTYYFVNVQNYQKFLLSEHEH